MSTTNGIRILRVAACAFFLGFPGDASADPEPANTAAGWTRGPPPDPEFFPLAVWLQSPANAKRYRDAGFNLYVGLWKGPTEAQLDALEAAGMKVICRQTEEGLRLAGRSTIIGWMHGDEPDNAQARPGGGYGPPVPPEDVQAEYRRMREADPTRPVFLNLGQGAAWDAWHGRGSRTNHPEDYPEYVRGADLVCFDIYPVTHNHPDVAGKLDWVGRGVARLVKWAGPDRPVWACIECSRIRSDGEGPTPEQIRAMAWLALIRGARGLVYFVHEWKPRFREASLLGEPERLRAVTELNREIRGWAPVLNSPTLSGKLGVRSSDGDGELAIRIHSGNGATWVFAMETAGSPTEGRFEFAPGAPAGVTVTEEGTGRRLPVAGREFRDAFAPWQLRIYRVAPALR